MRTLAKLSVFLWATVIAAATVRWSIAPPASAQAPLDAPSGDASVDEAALEARYLAQLSANDAAAERWKAEQQGSLTATDALSLDEALAVENQGCPEGTQYWMRDRVTEICAPLCSSDADCGPVDGRCRILDFADASKAPETILVDDVPAEEVDDWMEPTDEAEPPVMVCDPFWEIEGATDLDVTETVEE